jgi:hypothetical protein
MTYKKTTDTATPSLVTMITTTHKKTTNTGIAVSYKSTSTPIRFSKDKPKSPIPMKTATTPTQITPTTMKQRIPTAMTETPDAKLTTTKDPASDTTADRTARLAPGNNKNNESLNAKPYTMT